MQFVQHDLGYRRGGEIVEIVLSGSAANVRLMDSSNLSSYKSGRQHHYYGGLAKQSPVRLQIPHSGTWYVTVDMQGLRGSVRSSARILPGPLPELREAPLSSIPSLVQHEPPSGVDSDTSPSREYDVFISHASEDKDSVVRPLAHALSASGLKVWYDEFELRIGDSRAVRSIQGLQRVGLESWYCRVRFMARAGPITNSMVLSRALCRGNKSSCRSGTRSRRKS